MNEKNRLKIKPTFSDKKIFTDSFDAFFTSVGSEIHESIPPPQSNEEFSNYIREVHVNTPFEFSSIQFNEVRSTLLSLKDNKSHISTYPIKILKLIRYSVSPLLTIIMSKSLTEICKNYTSSANII